MGKVTSMKQPQVLSACDVDPCRSNILPLPALLPDLLKEEVSPWCQHVSTAIGWLLTFLFNKVEQASGSEAAGENGLGGI